MRKLFWILLAVLLAAVLIGPAVTGPMTEKALRQFAEQSSTDWVELKVASYQRSWFSADAVITIGLGGQYRELMSQSASSGDGGSADAASRLAEEFAAEQLKLPLAISHGPVFLANGFGFGAGRATGALDSSEVGPLADLERLAEIDSLFDVTLHTSFALNTTIEASSPSFVATTDEGEFASRGIEIDLHVGAVSGEISGDVDVLGGRFALADGTALTFGEIRNRLDLDLARQYLTLGDATSTMDAIQLVDPDGEEIAFGPATMAQRTWIADDGLLAFDARFTVAAASGPEIEVTEFVMQTSGGQLSPEAIVAYGEFNQRMVESISGGKPEVDTDQMMAEAATLARDALALSPTFDLSTLSFGFNGEPVAGSIDLDVNGAAVPAQADFRFTDIPMWKQVIGFDAAIELPAALTRQMMRASVRDQVQSTMGQLGQEMTEEELTAMVEAQVPLMLGMLESNGMLSKTDSGYRAVASFRDGQMTLNGATIPLPF